MRALVLVNPAARQGANRTESIVEQLQALNVAAVCPPASAQEQWPALIDAHVGDVDCVVVGGGDGTLRHSVASIMRNNLTLGVVPLGTGNDFARTLGIPVNTEQACRCIVDGVDHRIDVGCVNGVYFLNAASIGMAVRARYYRSDTAKRWLGSLGYANSVYAAFRDTLPFHARVVCDGVPHRLRSIQLAVGNGHYFGGLLAVSETSVLDDGYLDVCSLEPQGPGALLRLLPELVRGPGPFIRGGQLLRGKHIRVETRRHHAINTDGEILTRTPAVFSLLPSALRVRVPVAYRDEFNRRDGAGNV